MPRKYVKYNQEKSGFALVVALTLIAFVVLLLVTLSTWVGVEISMATKSEQREAAKSNALVGLAVALGELQEAAGPDQRVTAQADILSGRITVPESSKRYTGVWKTLDDTDASTVTDHFNQSQYDRWAWSTTDGATESATDGSWNRGPKWLVSSEEPLVNVSGVTLDTLNPSMGVVPILASKELTTTGEPGTTDTLTEVGIVPIGSASTPSDGYAWWVGDESVKASVALAGSEVADDLQGKIAQQKVFNRNTIETAADIAFDWADSEVLSKVDRVNSIDDFLSATDNATTADETGFKYTDHWTTYSQGLLTNVRDGGLKKDLTVALGEQWPEELAGKPLWYVYDGSNYLKGPMWDVIYGYSNIYREKQPWIPQFFGDASDKYLLYNSYNSAEPYTYVRNDSSSSYDGISDPNTRNPSLDVRGPGPVPNNNTTFYPSGETFRTYENSVRWRYTQGGTDDAGKHLDFYPEPEASGSSRQEPIDFNLAPTPLGVVTRVSIAALPLSVHWEKGRRDSNTSDIDDYYWSRDRLLVQLSDVVTTDLGQLTQSMTDLAGTDLADALQNHYALYLIIDPHVMVWNPFNVSLGPTDFEIIWLPGYKQSRGGDSGQYALDDWDFRIDADFQFDGTNYNHAPVFVPEGYGKVGGKKVDLNPDFNDTFIFATALNTSESQSSLKHYNGLTLSMETNTMAPGEVALYAMENARLFSQNVSLVDIGSANAVRGWIRPFPSKPIPAGAKINGMSIDLLDPSDFPSESWALQTKLEFDEIGIGNGVVSGKSRARSISHMIPEAAAGESTIERHFDTEYNVEDLVPASQTESANELALTAEPVGFLWALSKTADMADGGAPMFAQFNSAAHALLNVTDLNPQPFTWSIDFADPDAGQNVAGVADMLQGIVGWGNAYGGSGQDNITIYDVPRQPIMSVGELMHAGLSSLDTEPAYPAGGGYASPFVPLNESYTVHSMSGPNSNNDYHMMDVAYLTNEALMDRYFFSGIPEKSTANGGFRNISRTPPFGQEFDASYINDKGTLPNTRLKLNSTEEITDTYLDDRLRDRSLAATELMVDGPFNVNSTSKVAWKSVLAGFSGQPVETLTGSETLNDKYVFPRFSVPTGSEGDSWNGYRTLSEAELDALAEEIVQEVRDRGPFMSMADFVNRRLESNSERGEIAALQSAIDRTVNNATSDLGATTNLTNDGDWNSSRLNLDLLASKQGAGAPGWLLQNDILRSLEPVLTARSDTFRIRAYGETRNAFSGEVEGRAWCEAIVQRNPQYVGQAMGGVDDPTAEAAYTLAWDRSAHKWEATANTNLGDEAQKFGREFTIVGFRWLDESETQVLQ